VNKITTLGSKQQRPRAPGSKTLGGVKFVRSGKVEMKEGEAPKKEEVGGPEDLFVRLGQGVTPGEKLYELGTQMGSILYIPT